MGSGDRFTAWWAGSLGVGISIARFPFALTFNVQILFWVLSAGFGKAYDKPPGADPS